MEKFQTMRSQLTRQEESILDIWKSVLETLDKPIPDSDLIVLLAWAKQAGFPDNPKEAFSQETWGSLGDCLWDVLRDGDTLVSPLIVTWGIMNRVMSTAVGDSREESEEGSDVSGKSSSSGTSRTLTPLPEPPRVKYPSPKDYEKPVYPSPRDFVKPTYPSPAKLERTGAPEEAEAARRPPFAPVSLAVSLPSPAPKSGQSTGNQQSAGTAIPSAPALPAETMRSVLVPAELLSQLASTMPAVLAALGAPHAAAAVPAAPLSCRPSQASEPACPAVSVRAGLRRCQAARAARRCPAPTQELRPLRCPSAARGGGSLSARGSARRAGWQTQLAAGAGLCGAARPLSADGRARPASGRGARGSLRRGGGVAPPAALALATSPGHPEPWAPSGMPPDPAPCPGSLPALPTAGTDAAPVSVPSLFHLCPRLLRRLPWAGGVLHRLSPALPAGMDCGPPSRAVVFLRKAALIPRFLPAAISGLSPRVLSQCGRRIIAAFGKL